MFNTHRKFILTRQIIDILKPTHRFSFIILCQNHCTVDPFHINACVILE